MENFERKQLIRLEKREEYKMRLVPTGKTVLRDEEAVKEVLVRAKRLKFSEKCSTVFISKDLS